MNNNIFIDYNIPVNFIYFFICISLKIGKNILIRSIRYWHYINYVYFLKKQIIKLKNSKY